MSNEKHIEIAYILDRSGSMQPMQEPAVAAFNDFLKAQLAVPGEARLTLVQFDDCYEVPVASLCLQDVPQLTAATYVPRGSTALLDAIGRTIRDLDIRLQKLPPAHQPAKVILAIFTDGEENASTEYSAKHISDLIRLYRDTKGWEFLFLAANQDAIASAAKMNVGAGLAGNVAFSASGIRSTGKALARKVRASRLKATGQMDAAATADDAKSLDEVLREEEK
ncbi:MAG: VWA domain-containing protein [Verrucomicrobiaceae bacterium]|nr:VWA domain-containing protein [Verrucomicrobiaceae bacterium]